MISEVAGIEIASPLMPPNMCSCAISNIEAYPMGEVQSVPRDNDGVPIVHRHLNNRNGRMAVPGSCPDNLTSMLNHPQ